VLFYDEFQFITLSKIQKLYIHKNQGENKNVLLEFTATVPDDEEVQKKYQNKIIFSFDLKEFLKA